MTIVSEDDGERETYGVVWTPSVGVGTRNDLLANAKPFTDAEALMRAVDPQVFDPLYMATVRQKLDDADRTLTALGYIGVRRAVPKSRDERTPIYSPTKRHGGGRPPKYSDEEAPALRARAKRYAAERDAEGWAKITRQDFADYEHSDVKTLRRFMSKHRIPWPAIPRE